MLRLIGLIGPSGVGKSTIAAHLAAHYGARVLHMAGPVKALTHELYGVPVDAEKTPAVRSLYRSVGRAVRHVLGPDALPGAVVDALPDAGIVVVDDLRLAHEADYLRSFNATVIRVSPPVALLSDECTEVDYLHAAADFDVLSDPGDVGGLLTDVARCLASLGIAPTQ